jgi:hypothetical protein
MKEVQTCNEELIIESNELTFDSRHFTSEEVPYYKLIITYDESSKQYLFWLQSKKAGSYHKISKVYGIDGVGNHGALKSLMSQKVPFIEEQENGALTLTLVNRKSNVITKSGMALQDAPSQKPTQAQIIDNMKGASMADGWDIVVAYDLDVINNVLKTLYHDPNGKVVREIDLGSADDPYAFTYTVVNVPGIFVGVTMNVTTSLDFRFSEPGLQFSAGKNNNAVLDMPIVSAVKEADTYTLQLLSTQPAAGALPLANTWYKSTDGKTFTQVSADVVNKATDLSVFYLKAKDHGLENQTQFQDMVYNLKSLTTSPSTSVLDSGYSLEANVPIACLTGDGTVKTGDDVISFSTNNLLGNKIILHFNTQAGSGTSYVFTKNGQPVEPDFVKDFPDILDQLKNYFSENVKDIDYILTSIENNPAKATGSVTLTPHSFRFNTQQVNDQACLALFIQTGESNLPQGGTNLNFQTLANVPFIPICDKASSTLIFSRDFMSKYYLPSGLSQNNFSGVAGTGTTNSPISVAGTYNFSQSINIQVSLDLGFWESWSSNYTDASVDPVDFNGVPMTMTFAEDSQLTLGINVNDGTTLNLDWYDPGGPCMPGESGTDHFDVAVNIGIDPNKASKPLQWIATKEGDITLNFEISQGDYIVNIVVKKAPKPCNNDITSNIVSQITQKIGAILPGQSIKLNTLKTVAETNLLFNGNQRFTLDTSLNVSSPLDIVTFGSIS